MTGSLSDPSAPANARDCVSDHSQPTAFRPVALLKRCRAVFLHE